MKKPLLFFFFALLPLVASAYNAVIDGIYYDFSGGKASVTYRNGYYNSYSGSVSIPSSVTYNGKTYSVTSIGSEAFRGCSGLTSITIPNSVTSIGAWAFYGCSGLTSIDIPNSVTSIGSSAFYNCSGLTSIDIPNSVTSIGDWAFYNCSGLTSITVETGNANYDSRDNCNAIIETATNTLIAGCRNTIIPNSVTSIGGYAFYGCSGLTSITIPNSVTYIGSEAFLGCHGLTSITILCPKVVSWFSGITSIKEVILGNSVTSIGDRAFHGCSGLTSITIPNSVTSIGVNAFNNTQLKSVTIGSGVLSIGSNAFGNTRPVKVIWLTNTPPEGYAYAAGTVNYVANDLYTGLDNKTVYPYLSSIFEVDGVRYVPVSPSERTCDAIDCLYDSLATHINIGEIVSYRGVEMKVKDIKSYTFYQNPQILDISLGNDGYVGDYAFYGCSALKDVTLSNQGNIGNCAFANSNISSKLTIHSAGDIGTSAFANVGGAFSAEVDNKGAIKANAFQGCTKMQSVTLGDSITSIGSYAFDGCSALQSIIVPNAITWIGNSAFQGCSSLTNMQIGENVKTISDNAFNGCSSLPSINIPKSVTSIGNSVFSGCSALKTVVMEEDESELSLGSNGSNPLFSDCPLDSVYIGRNILYNTNSSKGYSPFYRNTSLRSIHITDKETEISANEFYGCTNLKNVHIGNGVTSIGNWAFSGCSSLDRFSFGHSVKSIGQEAFSDCTAMTRLMSLAPTPPACGSQALDDINKWSCTLTVPATHSEQYKVAEQWKEFFFIEEGERIDFTLTYMVDGETYKSYDMLKDEAITPEAEPTKEGYTFSGWSEIPETMPAQDVVVTGTFTVNSYVLTYMVDGEIYKTDSIAYGTSLTPEAEPTKDGYTFSGWSEIPETMPAEDVVVTGTFTVIPAPTTMALQDSEPYENVQEVNLESLTYTRMFSNEGWQPLYIPFSMAYEDWSDDFEVARINNVNQYDDDENGEVDRTVLEVFYVKSGKTEAHTPYLIRAKEAGEKTIALENTTIYAAEERSYDVSSWDTEFTFSGTYSPVSGSVAWSAGYYMLDNGVLLQAKDGDKDLNPYRWYMTATDRNGNSKQLGEVKVVVFGEDDTNGISIPSDELSTPTHEYYYDLSGRKNTKPQKGINLIRMSDGKVRKVIVK